MAARTDLLRASPRTRQQCRLQVTTAAGVVDGELESSDGYSVEVGIRSALGLNGSGRPDPPHCPDDPEVSIGGGAAMDISSFIDDDHTALVLNGQYKFNNGWGVIAEADIGSAYQGLLLGVRLSY